MSFLDESDKVRHAPLAAPQHCSSSPSRRDALKTGASVLAGLAAVLTSPSFLLAMHTSRSSQDDEADTSAPAPLPLGVEPFRINVPRGTLEDLRQRLRRTRWPDAVDGADWDYGVNIDEMRSIVGYWGDGFDWRGQEASLNQLPQFRTTVEGVGLHFVHVRGRGRPSGGAPIAIVLLHGWPGSFYQMSKLVPLLADPGSYGGDPADAFDVVVPSLPGFGFSDRPTVRGMTVGRMAPLIDGLMTRALGYARYAASGGDIGAGVVGQLAQQFPAHIIATQMNGGNPYIFQVPADLSATERAFVEKAQAWMQAEGAYAMLQSTKPQTLAMALNDSPAGLAAWLIERYRGWSDSVGPDGRRDVSRRFTLDELLTFVTLYWVTETIASSMRVYYEGAHDPAGYAPAKVAPGAAGPPPPAALAVWPGDIAVPPREWAERQGKLARFTVMPRGGHFPEWEEPQLVAEELRAFLRPFRA